METEAVIIGGGIAGLHCASQLAKMGQQTALVEKAPFLGGHVAQFACKATDRCRRCGACALEDVQKQTGASDLITTLVRTTVESVEQQNGWFKLSLLGRPPRIFPDECNDTECERACPAVGALVRSPLDNRLYLDEDKCLFFKDGSCRTCVEASPELAMDRKAGEEKLAVSARAVIVASGFKPFDATIKPRFGYGLVPGVVTALELDSMLRNDTWTIGEEDGEIRSVAFIQCVGSRDAKIGRNYCSRVCCGYALRMARLLKHRVESLRPTMFYMDIQNFEREFEERLKEAEKEVRLIRSIPAEVRRGADGRPELIYHGPGDERVIESFDLVVLSIGISPAAEDILPNLGTNRDGFVGLDGEEVGTQTEGIFVAGTVQGPRSIDETISHAIGAAGRAASYIRRISNGGAL
jgi:heterodisulfide reductase subunit A